ncbi:unnamed protein product [Lactuca saligna]|uniref:Uncharacterized protein n=1 Tax=Lactuca saligna TaxID=75948 RepID=A0AA35YMT2_LACSI|nr:unnamed protein product [Lactuca saligna]
MHGGCYKLGYGDSRFMCLLPPFGATRFIVFLNLLNVFIDARILVDVDVKSLVVGLWSSEIQRKAQIAAQNLIQTNTRVSSWKRRRQC